MRLPTPSAREVRWSFYLAALCTLALTATICWGIVHKVSQSDGVLHVAVANADQVQRLSDQIDAQAAESVRQRRLLKAQNRQVHAELTALLRYLRAHGIEIPRTAFTPPPPQSSRSTRPKAAQERPMSRPSDPASPAPTPTPTPASPPVTDLTCQLAPLVCH